MIVAGLMGRLGNQLFQYATARALALRLGVEVGLDGRSYRNGEPAGILSLQLDLAKPDDRTLPRIKPNLVQKIFNLKDRTPYQIFVEEKHSFDDRVLHLPDWTYLTGYFQNERYFDEYASVIRSDLSKNRKLSAEGEEMRRFMERTESVSVHVRRGDYIGDHRYDIIGPKYYELAVQRALQQIRRRPHFFLFSDDPQWVETNFRVDFPTTYMRQSNSAWEDLSLMSHCRHHIIANSSFSWWAAWLRYSAEKVIVAPKTWLNIPGKDASDVVPANWLRV